MAKPNLNASCVTAHIKVRGLSSQGLGEQTARGENFLWRHKGPRKVAVYELYRRQRRGTKFCLRRRSPRNRLCWRRLAARWSRLAGGRFDETCLPSIGQHRITRESCCCVFTRYERNQLCCWVQSGLSCLLINC